MKGYLKQQGWGAEMGYPGIVLDDTGNEIRGYIFCSDNLVNHWDELDNFEGEEYERVLIKVQKKDLSAIESYIYILRKS